MSEAVFKAGGALTDEHADIYIERQADQAAISHLRAMDYLLLIEPRQQGKTSLVNRLMRHRALSGYALAYIDVTPLRSLTEADWYQALASRILGQLDFASSDPSPIPHNSIGWRGFLHALAVQATAAHQHAVIALDEIGAVTFPGATEFFSVLRDVYNSRQAETAFRQLTFLLVGAFHPRDLIQDERVSPFNIAERVRLRDWQSAQEIEKLTQHLLSPHQSHLSADVLEERARGIAERIHHWANGQPYLTQWLCKYLTRYGKEVTASHVDEAVNQLRQEDDNHLPPMLDRLKTDEKLCAYIKRIMEGERIKFYPRENNYQAQLELLGVIKADTEGYCIIRNHIYEQALAETGILTLPMHIPVTPQPDYKRKALASRRAALIEEYETASAQLSRTLSDAERLRLERQLDSLELEIQSIDDKLE